MNRREILLDDNGTKGAKEKRRQNSYDKGKIIRYKIIKKERVILCLKIHKSI